MERSVIQKWYRWYDWLVRLVSDVVLKDNDTINIMYDIHKRVYTRVLYYSMKQYFFQNLS